MLLQTKLHIPVTRRSLVPRAALLEKLDAGLRGRLTLVAAPAGFGKSTLIARWGQLLGEGGLRQLAWLSLDARDDDLVRFFSYVIAALQTVDHLLGISALELLQSPQIDDIHVVLTTLLNDIAAADQGIVLVLDDYHLLTRREVHEAVSFLMEHAPASFHLVLLTRADPPFSLARYRARHQITEIRQDDLRFSHEETQHFLGELMALDMPEEAVRALEKRTEGWAAGLQMAALSLQGRSDADRFIADFAGSHRYIFDYLAEEALARRPAGTRAFLLQTALLDRLCGPLCDAVLQQSGSQQILEQLESANLFLVPLDETRHWYRYHHLFSDLLRHYLRREQPEQFPALHLRASHWYEEAGHIDEAVQHALAAESFERAAALVAEHSTNLLVRGEINRLRQWLEKLPPQWRHRHPQIILNHAWVNYFRDGAQEVEATLAHMPEEVAVRPPYSAYLLHLRGTMAARERDTERAIALSKEAEERLSTLPDGDNNRITRGANALNLANAYHWHGDVARAEAQYERAIALNRGSRNLVVLMNAIRGQGILRVEQARLRQAEIAFLEGLKAEREWGIEMGASRRKFLAAAPLHLSLGKLYYEGNRLDVAEAHLADAVELLALSGPINRSEGLTALTRLRLALDDPDAVPPLLRELEALRERVKGGYARHRVIASLAEARCALYRNRPSAELRAALQQSLTEMGEQPDAIAERAQLFLALDRPAEALSLLDPLLPRLDHSQRPGRWLPAAVWRCVANQLVGRERIAVEQLAGIVRIAGPAGYVRLFLDPGPPLARLLKLLADGRPETTLATTLLSYFPLESVASSLPAWQPHSAAPPANPLSPRETEVLQLVAQGLTNREIAAALVIAPSTAKRHTVNIYNKLGVGNRAEATARAYELGLIT